MSDVWKEMIYSWKDLYRKQGWFLSVYWFFYEFEHKSFNIENLTSTVDISVSDDMYLQTAPQDRLPKMDELQPKVGYEDIEELKKLVIIYCSRHQFQTWTSNFKHIYLCFSAPLNVRRLFSASYGWRKDKTAVWKRQLLDLVRQHKLDEKNEHGDNSSLEAKS